MIVNLKLTLEEIQYIIDILGSEPYKNVVTLIETIASQTNSQIEEINSIKEELQKDS